MDGADEVTSPLSFRRRRPRLVRFLVVVLVMTLGAASCTSGSSGASQAEFESGQAATDEAIAVVEEPRITPAATPTAVRPNAVPPAATPTALEPEPSPTPHPIAAADTELPPAPIGVDQLDQLSPPQGPQPVSIEIENIDVRDASVIPVGVNQEDLSFEVPPADQVGWYEFGPRPGQPGSSVLAAHIAFNGVDGVFRYLEDVEIGSIVVIGFDDGTTSRYRIEEVVEYVKEELPDSLFARDGREQLALITCGGSFNYQLDSYESNTVAIAVPL